MCRAVLKREPREAKIFPLIPMAAGIMMINPGRNSRVSEKDPRYMPPINDPREARINEIIPCLKTVALAARKSSLSAREMIMGFFFRMESFIL
jgi:hypothetical protein